MEELWISGICFLLKWYMILMATIVIIQLVYCTLRWIDDKKQRLLFQEFLKGFFKNDDGETIFQISIIIITAIGVACIFWPFVIMIGIFFAIVFSLRGFRRFTKKVNKVLDGKANKNHKHKK